MKAKTFTKETINSFGIVDKNYPEFSIGDKIAVSQWITEGNKKRIQIFEGHVIAKKNNGASTTFTVRKIGANSVAVERIYPYYSPLIDSIKLITKGKVRRAKLYYLRDKIGKAAKIKEKRAVKKKKKKNIFLFNNILCLSLIFLLNLGYFFPVFLLSYL